MDTASKLFVYVCVFVFVLYTISCMHVCVNTIILIICVCAFELLLIGIQLYSRLKAIRALGSSYIIGSL